MNDFAQREPSWRDGYPVEFYRFIRNDDIWRYNTSDRILTRDTADEPPGNSYLPLSITRERIQQGSERNKLQLSVVIPRDADVAELWHPYPTSSSVGLTIFAGHIEPDMSLDASEPGAVESSSVVWIGRVVSPKFKPESITLLCEPSTTLARKSGQTQCWQRGCMHVLYKQGHGLCNANKDDFKITSNVVFANNVRVDFEDLSAVPDGRLAGGYMEWETDDGHIERRSINTHSGDSVNIMYGTIDLPDGAEVTLYPGCRHNYDDCENYFNNGPNYGGDLYSPERSPFNGLPVF